MLKKCLIIELNVVVWLTQLLLGLGIESVEIRLLIDCCYMFVLFTVGLQSLSLAITFQSRLLVLRRYDVNRNCSSYNQQ